MNEIENGVMILENKRGNENSQNSTRKCFHKTFLTIMIYY